MARILITGGTVVTATETMEADVLVEGERVVALFGRDGDSILPMTPDQVIDATGKYVMPGGVDVHTHMQLPFGGTYASDDFESGSRAAAWGGTTTIVDFAVQTIGEPMMAGYESWMALAEGNCAIDYGFHMIVSDVNDQTLKEMDILMGEGVTSFKLFMAYPGVLYSDDGQIFRAMQKAAENGSTIMMHAENGIVIDVLREQALARGETDPIYHSITRPPITEAEATHRAIAYAELAGCPLYVVHMSAKEALDEICRGPRSRLQHLRRDLPSVSVPGVEEPSRTRLRRRQVRVFDAGPERGARPSGGTLARPGHQRPPGGVHGSLPVLHERSPDAGHAEATRCGRFHEDPQRAAGRRGTDGRCSITVRSAKAGCRSTGLSKSVPRHPPRCSGCTPRRAPSPSGPTPTS